MGVLDASRFRLVMCWKRFCGFSTQVRNGTCCRKAIRTTKLCIDAFKLGAATRFCVGHAPTGRGTIFILRSKFLSYRGRGSPGGSYRRRGCVLRHSAFRHISVLRQQSLRVNLEYCRHGAGTKEAFELRKLIRRLGSQ